MNWRGAKRRERHRLQLLRPATGPWLWTMQIERRAPYAWKTESAWHVARAWKSTAAELRQMALESRLAADALPNSVLHKRLACLPHGPGAESVSRFPLRKIKSQHIPKRHQQETFVSTCRYWEAIAQFRPAYRPT